MRSLKLDACLLSMQAPRMENTLSIKAEHEPDLYPASKSSKVLLTLDIAEGRIQSSRARSAVYLGLPLPLCLSLVLVYSWFLVLLS